MDTAPGDGIRLEEGVTVPLRPAGLATRILARALDGLCQVLLAGAWLAVPGALAQRIAVETQQDATVRVTLLAVAALGILASAWLYPVYFEIAWNGRTPGKRALGLRVVDASGQAPSVQAVVVRNLLLVVDLLPGLGLVGLVTALADRRHRRVGDLVAGTLVVRS